MKASHPTKSPIATAPALTVRVAQPHEAAAFDGQLADHHYLGAGRPVGDYLRQLVERDGQPVALLVWGPSCYALKDRDLWISWSASQRVERLKLVVQNRRFLLLAAKGQSPNLASQSLGAALRALPGQWREHFGYRPLLAESFTDPEAYAGTCYKASNWEPVGFSAGYSRHRADFYVVHERPKKLWLRELSPQARTQLRAPQVPEECRPGLVAPPAGVLPVTSPQMKSLLDVFRRAPDPRDSNAQYRTGPVLTLLAMALLAGRRDIAEIARFATTLSQPQRRQLGLLTLAQHEDGAPQALAVYDQKEGTERCELTAATALLERQPALGRQDHHRRCAALPAGERERHRGKRGRLYLVQIKGNQPRLLKQARALDALVGTPFLSRPNAGTAASKSASSMPSPSNR